jgi:hypothetical protein
MKNNKYTNILDLWIVIFIFLVILNINTNSLYAQTKDTVMTIQGGEISYQADGDKVMIVNDVKEPYRFNLGLKLGVTTGSGICFGMDRIEEDWSLDVTIMPIALKNFNLTLLGASVKYSLQDLERYNLYLNAGMSYNYFAEAGTGNKREDPVRVGIGFGFMQFISTYIAYDLQLLGTYFTTTGDFYPVPQITLQYHFK